MKRILLIAAAVAALAMPVMAQELPPVGETTLSHKHELVGVIDGCRVWKIDFWGQGVFVTRCPGSGEAVSQTQWRSNCGKNCTKENFVPTSNE